MQPCGPRVKKPEARPKSERRGTKRLLCSDLVQLLWKGPQGTRHREIVILENLSGSGAGLFMGVAVPEGTPVQLIASDLQVSGEVSHCRFRENGYVVGLKLNTDVSGKEFIPEHLLDVSLLELD